MQPSGDANVPTLGVLPEPGHVPRWRKRVNWFTKQRLQFSLNFAITNANYSLSEFLFPRGERGSSSDRGAGVLARIFYSPRRIAKWSYRFPGSRGTASCEWQISDPPAPRNFRGEITILALSDVPLSYRFPASPNAGWIFSPSRNSSTYVHLSLPPWALSTRLHFPPFKRQGPQFLPSKFIQKLASRDRNVYHYQTETNHRFHLRSLPNQNTEPIRPAVDLWITRQDLLLFLTQRIHLLVRLIDAQINRWRREQGERGRSRTIRFPKIKRT